MNSELKTKWIEGLRSGEYLQGRNNLVKETTNNMKYSHSYCCLGVLCDIVVKSDPSLAQVEFAGWGDIPTELEGKTRLAAKWCDTLIKMNDMKSKTFKKIALYIESSDFSDREFQVEQDRQAEAYATSKERLDSLFSRG